jgi:2-keto-4-pentenoate hydratase/2-oxohepta-3-ene-1,7-dioic acid hydratase in catechol pathway
MKLITFADHAGQLRLGGVHPSQDNRVIDFHACAEMMAVGKEQLRFCRSMLDFIEGGPSALDLGHELIAFARQRPDADCANIPAKAVSWRSPLPVPPQLRDCLMFEEHLLKSYSMLRETLAEQSPDPVKALADFEERGLYGIPDVWYEIPVYYKANRFSFIGHEQDIVHPDYTQKLDFELEYACVLNSITKDVDEVEAAKRIFGYTIFNDVSARDVQSVEMQASLGPSKGKDFDTGNVLGPCIVTADEVDTDDMVMIARVNGEEWCRGNSGSARWSFEQVIAHASRCETLVAGELIGSGTVGGGCGLEHGRFLKRGDMIELEVGGIGILRNRVV